MGNRAQGEEALCDPVAKGRAMSAILVTGAARRIGREMALDLAAHGQDIALHFNASLAEAEEVAKAVRAKGRKVALVQGDLAAPDSAERLMAAAVAQLGAVSALINNASIYEWDVVGDVTAESWQRHMDINLRAPVMLAQAFARALPAGQQGNVINIIDGRVLKLNPRYFSYTISKSALWSATQMLAQALAPAIRVNAIGPGPVLPPKGATAADHAADEAATLLQHGSSPAEIAGAVRFILSQPSLTGQMIALDSGQHLVFQSKVK
jgi:NAD(P)-dependent dehydrogenase (short-subunit alcohol dehydrogenase family)